MAIHNMACPRCGKVSTEWQEGKWRCLSCDNYFLFKDDPAPLTVLNSNVSIAGDALYDLDTSKTQKPVPVMTPWLELHQPISDSEYANIEIKKGGHKPLIGIIVMGTIFLALACSGSAKYAVPFIVAFGFWVSCIVRNRNINACNGELDARRAYLSNIKEVTGYSVLCPHCKKEHTKTLLGSFATVGLTHCLSCGKQFYVGNGSVSVPLKSHSSRQEESNLPVGQKRYIINC